MKKKKKKKALNVDGIKLTLKKELYRAESKSDSVEFDFPYLPTSVIMVLRDSPGLLLCEIWGVQNDQHLEFDLSMSRSSGMV